MITKEELIQSLVAAAKEWLYDSEDFTSYMDINSGSCGEFALYVKEKLTDSSNVEVVSTKRFLPQQGVESYGDGTYSNQLSFNSFKRMVKGYRL